MLLAASPRSGQRCGSLVFNVFLSDLLDGELREEDLHEVTSWLEKEEDTILYAWMANGQLVLSRQNMAPAAFVRIEKLRPITSASTLHQRIAVTQASHASGSAVGLGGGSLFGDPSTGSLLSTNLFASSAFSSHASSLNPKP